jgi:anaerobic ribonucleoside-triphosphate reductase
MLMDTRRIQDQEQERTDCEKIGEGLGFERTRRITGYLVGTLDRFNNAKRAEERDRVRHSV